MGRVIIKTKWQVRAERFRKALGDNTPTALMAFLWFALAGEWLFRPPYFGVSASVATAVGLLLLAYLVTHLGSFSHFKFGLGGVSGEVTRSDGGDGVIAETTRSSRREYATVTINGGLSDSGAKASGSNSDGEWVRFQNGLQICQARKSSSVKNVECLFPKPFSAPPNVFLGGKLSGHQPIETTPSEFVVMVDENIVDFPIYFEYFAVGR